MFGLAWKGKESRSGLVRVIVQLVGQGPSVGRDWVSLSEFCRVWEVG